MTNRLRPSMPFAALAPTGKLAPDDPISTARYTAGENGSHTALFAPLHYERNYAYPLLIWLHPTGDDESQLKRIMPLVSMRNYVAVAPRGLQSEGGLIEKPVFGWSASGASSRKRDGDTWTTGHIAAAEHRVFEAIEAAQARYHVSPRRIFIAGYDDGGTMAFRLAMDYPHRFAGVLSLCGRFPSGQTALKRILDARQVPIFLACGRDSRRYAATEVCQHLKLFHSAGMNVSLRQYPCGHEMVPAMLADMDRWIMEQMTASSAVKTEDACIEDFDLFGH